MALTTKMMQHKWILSNQMKVNRSPIINLLDDMTRNTPCSLLVFPTTIYNFFLQATISLVVFYRPQH